MGHAEISHSVARPGGQRFGRRWQQNLLFVGELLHPSPRDDPRDDAPANEERGERRRIGLAEFDRRRFSAGINGAGKPDCLDHPV
jgi:hypothetical protein